MPKTQTSPVTQQLMQMSQSRSCRNPYITLARQTWMESVQIRGRHRRPARFDNGTHKPRVRGAASREVV